MNFLLYGRKKFIFVELPTVCCYWGGFFMPGKKFAGAYPYCFLVMVFMMAVLLWPAAQAESDVRVVPQTVRVGLTHSAPQVSFSLRGAYRLINANTGQVIAEDREGHNWTVENAGGLLHVLRDGNRMGIYNGPIKAEEINVRRSILSGHGSLLQKETLSGAAVVGMGGNLQYLSGDRQSGLHVIDGRGQINLLPRGQLNLVHLEGEGRVKRYRGNLEIRVNGDGLTVINELPIEQYLYGVVPSEMPATFPLEALKAQAVAARSYLIAQLGSYGSHGFDVMDSQASQIYRGYDVENEVTTKAVDETRGLVLVYRGQPVAAFFHSSSGGFTENSEDVYSDALGYVRGQKDPFDKNDKYYNWSVSYSAGELTDTVNQQLKKFMRPEEYHIFAAITDLQELERTGSGHRVKKLLITGPDIDGNLQRITVYNAERVRMALGLRSAMFTMHKELRPDGGISRVTFTGSGWGHGLGMSQWGAAGMAAGGYSFQDILQYYYTGIELLGNYGM